MNSLLIASAGESSADSLLIRKFAKWMGVQTQAIVIGDGADAAERLFDAASSDTCVALSADTLSAVYRSSKQPQELLRLIQSRCAALLVFGCIDSSQQGEALSWLTHEAIKGVIRTTADSEQKEFLMPSGARPFSRQLAGLCFSIAARGAEATFTFNVNATDVETILLANQEPAFITLQRGACRLFLIAGSDIPDIDLRLSRTNGIEEHYDRIIPLLIFLRTCCAQQCWRPSKGTARLIIDDPLLADRYGHLKYDALLDSMARKSYGTSIAFIPWNHRRTSRAWAAKLREKNANLTICIHGCDHTNREFASPDADILQCKASLAWLRMQNHHDRVGIAFEPVMVFPQGKFSTAAISALRRGGYLAAVNTTAFPTSENAPKPRMADFLRPAITCFDGFPVFLRHYPKRLIDFAFDLFLGKPCLIVEHHEYFKDGFGSFEEFISELYRIDPSLAWPPLSEQFVETYWIRHDRNGAPHVKFFTRRFMLKNTEPETRRFWLEKDEPDPSMIQAVLVDGRTVSFSSNDGHIEFEIQVGPYEERTIEVQDYPKVARKMKRPGIAYRTGVFFRRELSEFRDNALSKHPALLRAGKRAARRLKLTGDK